VTKGISPARIDAGESPFTQVREFLTHREPKPPTEAKTLAEWKAANAPAEFLLDGEWIAFDAATPAERAAWIHECQRREANR